MSDSENSEKSYKLDKNGNEFYYYCKKKPVFAYNKENDQIYAKDLNGNEIYPKRGIFLAQDRYANYYYARDVDGNEYYPTFRKFDVMIPKRRGGDVLIARFKSCRQRYPKDKMGQEHYPVTRDLQPFYLLNEEGSRYEATFSNRDPVEIGNAKNHVYQKTDVLGNEVYTTDPKLGRRFRALDLTLLSVVCLGNVPLLVGLALTFVI